MLVHFLSQNLHILSKYYDFLSHNHDIIKNQGKIFLFHLTSLAEIGFHTHDMETTRIQ